MTRGDIQRLGLWRSIDPRCNWPADKMNVWYGRMTGVGTLRTIPAPLAMSDPAGKADLVAALLRTAKRRN